jgi:hypothetical protein
MTSYLVIIYVKKHCSSSPFFNYQIPCTPSPSGEACLPIDRGTGVEVPGLIPPPACRWEVHSFFDYFPFPDHNCPKVRSIICLIENLILFLHPFLMGLMLMI